MESIVLYKKRTNKKYKQFQMIHTPSLLRPLSYHLSFLRIENSVCLEYQSFYNIQHFIYLFNIFQFQTTWGDYFLPYSFDSTCIVWTWKRS